MQKPPRLESSHSGFKPLPFPSQWRNQREFQLAYKKLTAELQNPAKAYLLAFWPYAPWFMRHHWELVQGRMPEARRYKQIMPPDFGPLERQEVRLFGDTILLWQPRNLLTDFRSGRLSLQELAKPS